MDDLTGKIIGGRYRVESFEGHGGMANVYKVWDAQRAVYLAMKILHSDLAEDRVFLRRFQREAHVLERLQHPNIVRFYGLEEADGLAYILMDHIDGLTLRREIHLNKKGLRPARILQIMQPVCAALHYAHQMGMVHCDIKPVNIIIHRNGTVYLADFGIARVAGARTQTALVSGTPAYMAPELSLGEEPTPAADIYALGVVLYEMLTGGERPFSGSAAIGQSNAAGQILWEKNHLDPPPPSRFNRLISPELEAVTLHCLERDPNLRFGSAMELAAALGQAVHGAGGNYDIQTLVGIDLSPRGSAPQPSWEPDEAFQAPAADEQPAEYSRHADRLMREDAALFETSPFEPEPPDAEEPDNVEILEAGDGPNAETAEGAGAVMALALAKPGVQPEALLPGRRTWRVSKWWLPAGIGLLLVLAIAFALAGGRPLAGAAATTPAAPAGTAAQTRQESVPNPATATPAVIAAAATPTPPPPTPSPQPTVLGGASGQIAFASDRSGSVQIWVMDAANPDRREQVTRLEEGACQPAWSPDGARIAFITPCKGPRLTYPGAGISIIDLATGGLTSLNLPGSAFDPAWSPDGKTIAYTTFIEGRTVIYAVNLDEMRPYPLAAGGQKNEDPAWSPDGETIAYISDNKGVDEIWVMHKDGSSKEMVTEAGLLKYFSGPKWAPDGRWIAAMMKAVDMPAPVPVLVLLDRFNGRDGGAPLLNETMRMEDGNFSADGQWLVFWTLVDHSNMEILRASRTGQVQQLTDHPARDFHPAWGWH